MEASGRFADGGVRRRALRPVLLGMALIGVLAVMVGGLLATEGSGPTGPHVPSPHASSAGRPVAETMVIRVRPVDEQGRLRRGFAVTATVQDAKCYAGSSVKVASAHGCVAGEYIYDPCWTEMAGPSGPSVVCMREPWPQTVERLFTETDTTPEPAAPDYDDPWWLELVDGQRCRISTGAHASVNPSSGDDADVVDYSCGEQLGLVLLRGIDKAHPVWTARAARYVKGRYERMEPQSIATAWF